MPEGVAQFYYTRDLPPHAVALARVAARPSTAADLVDINSIPYAPGSLVIKDQANSREFDAAVLGHSVAITGAASYLVENQFFEISNLWDGQGRPYYYQHLLPGPSIKVVNIYALDGTEITEGFEVRDGRVLHSFDGAAYHVKYYENRSQQTRLLQYVPVMRRAEKAAANSYVFNSGSLLTVFDKDATYFVRFIEGNGYRVLMPYGAPPNEPWYARIRFHLRPIAPEWARQVFIPRRPYQLTTWTPGKVLARNLLEFERRPLYWDPIARQFPDVLVYDRDYQIKYALDGMPAGSFNHRGYLFPWRTSQFVDIDPAHARVQVNVDLEPDDIAFAFYSYQERDVVFRGLDVNPFTNPAVRDAVIRFYYKSQPDIDPLRVIYYEVLSAAGVLLQTNDLAHGSGARHDFGSLVVGFSVGTGEFQIEDIRVRGGGLAPEHQNIEQASHMWDLGYWDGKPYPLGGGMCVMLPRSILDRFTEAEVQAKLQSIIPLGVLPLIRYYDETGEEWLGAATRPFDSIPGVFDEIPGLFDSLGVRQ